MGGPATATVEQDAFLPDGDDFFDAYMSSRETVGGDMETAADKSETYELMTWGDKLNALEQQYGGRVFTYKQYSGTVRELVACPHFSLKLEDSVEAAANWLETHDGTLEDIVEEDENEDGDKEDNEEPQNSVEENQSKPEPEKPVIKEVKPEEHKPEPVMAAREPAEEPVVEAVTVEIEPETQVAAPAEVVTAEPVREDVARQGTHDSASVGVAGEVTTQASVEADDWDDSADRVIGIDNNSVTDEKGKSVAAAVEEMAVGEPKEIMIPLPVRDEVEVHIDLGRRAEKNPPMQVEDAVTEEREIGKTDGVILQPEVLHDTGDPELAFSHEASEAAAGDAQPEVDFYAPTVVFDGEAEQVNELIDDAETAPPNISEENDETEKELMDIAETANNEAMQPEELENVTDISTSETMHQESVDSPLKHVLKNEIVTEDLEEIDGFATEQVAETMQIEQIVRLVELVGEQPAGESAVSTKELRGRVMLLVAKIEILEQAKTAEACHEAIAEIREELTALLLLMGYANANELAERLIRQYDIRQLKKHMIAIVRALSSPERVVPSSPFHVQLPLWHKCGIHVVGMVTRLKAA